MKIVKSTFFIIPQQLKEINIYSKFSGYNYEGALMVFDTDTLLLDGVCEKMKDLFNVSMALLKRNYS